MKILLISLMVIVLSGCPTMKGRYCKIIDKEASGVIRMINGNAHVCSVECSEDEPNLSISYTSKTCSIMKNPLQ